MTTNKNIQVFWWSWVKFENKDLENFGDIISKFLVKEILEDGVKFKDYFISVDIEPYRAECISEKMNTKQALTLIDQFPNLWGTGVVDRLSHQLMEVCPFKA